MLVLKRKVGERVMLSNGITLTVCEVSRNGVKLGIEAPEEVEIWREELGPWRREKDGTPLRSTGDGKRSR